MRRKEVKLLQNEITREEIIAAARPFVRNGVKNPDELFDSAEEAAKELWLLHDEWVQRESQRVKDLTIDEAVHSGIAMNTLWYDAGFTDPNLLDEMSGDWLINTLDLADGARRRDLAKQVKAKILEIQKKIKEQDPTYEIWDPDSATLTDWNPPRKASPGEFYADYAYFLGPEKATVEEATSQYLRFHSDADVTVVRGQMQQAAAEYTEER